MAAAHIIEAVAKRRADDYTPNRDSRDWAMAYDSALAQMGIDVMEHRRSVAEEDDYWRSDIGNWG